MDAVELRQLRYFVTVAEELHFGRAADRLHIVQPAVSQQVGRLERELGVRLFDRSSRYVRLTVAGERLLDEARTVLAAADRIAAVAAELGSGRTPRLRVGTSPGLGRRLETAVRRLHDRAPETEVELVGGSALDHLDAVRRGELGAALVRGVTGVAGLTVVELWRDELRVALPAEHPLARQPVLRLARLAGLPLRLPSRDCDPLFHDHVVHACREAGFEPCLGRPVQRYEDALAEIGGGRTAWTVVHDDPSRRPGDRVALVPTDPPLSIPGSLVVTADQAPECVASFLDAFGTVPPVPPPREPVASE